MCKKLILKILLKISIEFSCKFCMCPKGWFSKIGSQISYGVCSMCILSTRYYVLYRGPPSACNKSFGTLFFYLVNKTIFLHGKQSISYYVPINVKPHPHPWGSPYTYWGFDIYILPHPWGLTVGVC